MFEDTGKNEAVRAASRRAVRGCWSRVSFVLRLGAAQKAANDPAKRELLDKKEALERKIDR